MRYLAASGRVTRRVASSRRIRSFLREGIRADEEAAVNAEGLAGGEGRLVRTEPQNGFGHFSRRAEASQGVQSANAFIKFWFAEGAGGHVRLDHCGADGIHADAFLGTFGSGRLGQSQHAMFASDINARAGRAN